MIELAGLLLASAVLVVLSMLFSISESSFLSMNKLRLRILRREKDRRAVRAGRLLEKKEILINTLLVANDLVNILLSPIVTAVAMR
ncbi:MAG: CNNM domain-containing protein, partial [Treponemataceae bacterium]|nr:CNNM domain-containing protein [Treponemataceae bacterium]